MPPADIACPGLYLPQTQALQQELGSREAQLGELEVANQRLAAQLSQVLQQQSLGGGGSLGGKEEAARLQREVRVLVVPEPLEAWACLSAWHDMALRDQRGRSSYLCQLQRKNNTVLCTIAKPQPAQR